MSVGGSCSGPEGLGVGLNVRGWKRGKPTNGRQDKIAAGGLAHVVRLAEVFELSRHNRRHRSISICQRFQRVDRHRLDFLTLTRG